MSAPLVVSVPHRLGKDEATRRLKSGLEAAKSKFGQFLSVQEETWVGNHLQFRLAALGQSASGTIEVTDDHARLEVTFPWLLAKMAEHIERAVKAQGTIMLEKK